MTKWGSTFLLAGVVAACVASASAEEKAGPLGFKMKSIAGKEVDLAEYKGKVVLMVNVASRCGYTPQYEGLEKLYEKYKDQGFVIIGFPANNFGGQEPGSNEQIKTFCTSKYNVTFPMMSKISVKGDDQHPLYKMLTSEKGEVKWNFNKFLIGKDGKIIEHGELPADDDPIELGEAHDVRRDPTVVVDFRTSQPIGKSIMHQPTMQRRIGCANQVRGPGTLGAVNDGFEERDKRFRKMLAPLPATPCTTCASGGVAI